MGAPDVMRLFVCAALLCAGIASAETWHGLRVAPGQRCSPYRAGDCSYPQSVEPLVVAQTGKVYGLYTGRCVASPSETDIEHLVARSVQRQQG